MGETTVDDYLTYIPGDGVQDIRHGSSSRTTMPSNPRDLEDVEILTWESFVETVNKQRIIALNSKAGEELEPLYEKKRTKFECQNESEVERALDYGLFEPLQRLMIYLGFPGRFRSRPQAVILNPDYSWERKMRKESTERSSPNTADASPIDTILVEVKSFWAFNPPDDLVPILESQSQAKQSAPPAKRSKKDDSGDTEGKVMWAVS
ncbi:unnamed protein product [Calypogeia fissa]